MQIAWEWNQSSKSASYTDSDPLASWERSQSAFKDKLISLNKRIRDYNLQVPNTRFQRPVLNFDQELEKITSFEK